MKRVFNLLLMAGATAAAQAQLANTPHMNWTVPASMYAESGSNRLPSAISNRFMLGGHIPSSRIDRAADHLTENLRAGVFAINSLNIHRSPEGPDTLRGVRGLFNHPQFILFQQQTGGIRFNDDGFRLMFQGNGDYLGQQLDARVDRARFMRYTALRMWFTLPLQPAYQKGRKSEFSLGLAPALLNNYAAADDFRALISTDTLAQQVDADWSGTLKSTRRGRFVNGWGALVSIGYTVRPTRGKIKYARFAVYDIGVFRAQNVVSRFRQAGTGGNIRLTAENTTLAEVFGGNWFANRRDTLMKDLQLDSSRSSAWLLSPFSLSGDFRTRHLRVGVRWRNVTGFLPWIDLRPAKMMSKGAFEFAPSVSFGGFDTWNLNAHLGWNTQKAKGLSATLQLQGLEAMAFPGRQHGAGGMISIMFII